MSAVSKPELLYAFITLSKISHNIYPLTLITFYSLAITYYSCVYLSYCGSDNNVHKYYNSYGR